MKSGLFGNACVDVKLKTLTIIYVLPAL